jgi:hypothetical protein
MLISATAIRFVITRNYKLKLLRVSRHYDVDINEISISAKNAFFYYAIQINFSTFKNFCEISQNFATTVF